jgi:hypothetical protein
MLRLYLFIVKKGKEKVWKVELSTNQLISRKLSREKKLTGFSSKEK